MHGSAWFISQKVKTGIELLASGSKPIRKLFISLFLKTETMWFAKRNWQKEAGTKSSFPSTKKADPSTTNYCWTATVLADVRAWWAIVHPKSSRTSKSIWETHGMPQQQMQNFEMSRFGAALEKWCMENRNVTIKQASITISFKNICWSRNFHFLTFYSTCFFSKIKAVLRRH